MYAVQQNKICAEYRDMLLSPRLFFFFFSSGTPQVPDKPAMVLIAFPVILQGYQFV